MNNRRVISIIAAIAAILATLSCYRSDIRSTRISVPSMTDARSIRIVTNAALDEVIGKYDGNQNAAEVNLATQVILYHESQALLSKEYQRQLVARIAEVGYKAHVVSVRHNPPPPVPTIDGPVQMWPGRFTATIAVSGLEKNVDANIVLNAIAYARAGRDHPQIAVHPSSHSLDITFDSQRLSTKNIEYAIACAGFSANGTPAKLGQKDAPPHGWTPVAL